MLLYGLIILITGYYAAVLLMKPGFRGFETGVIGLLIAFAWGYRTIELDPPIQMHPIEILVWLLFFRALNYRSMYRESLPGWALALLLFSVWGVLRAFANEIDYRVNISYFKNFILFFPLFVIVGRYMLTEQKLGLMAYYYVLAISIISFFGVLEYYFPFLMPLFPGFFSSEAVGYITQGFQRATFSFWGAPTAGHVIISGLPLLLIARKYQPVFRRKYVFQGVLLLNLVALYITGNRADWMTLMVLLIFYLHLYEHIFRSQLLPLLLAGIGITATILVNFISQSAKDRFMSGVIALQGKADYVSDSSGFERNQRIQDAFQNAIEHPFGMGWGGTGWVHSDFTQLAAELGLIPGIIFLGAFILTYRKAYKLQGHPMLIKNERQNLVALLLCFTAVGIMLLINGHYILAQCGVPLFFIWVTLHVYMQFVRRQAAMRMYERTIKSNETRHHPAVANL